MSGSRILRRIAEDFDWLDYIETHFDYKVGNGKNGAEYKVICPACQNRKQKCYVNPERKLFNCYNCDFHTGRNDVFDFVAQTEGMSRGQAILKLLNEYQPTTPDDNIFLETLHHVFVKPHDPELDPVEIRTITGLPQQARKLTPGDPGGALFLRYLTEERGLTEREVVAMQTHYIPDKSVPVYDESFSPPKFKGDIGQRVLWPIYGGDGDLVSWQAREIPGVFLGDPDREESDQKYYFCPDSDAAKTFWPYVPPHDDHVVLVEGILDCMAVRRLGAPWSGYACFTKHLSEDQIKVLKRWGVKKVTLFWDKRDAKKAMIRAAEHLVMRNFEPYVCDLRDWPTDLDPGKCLKLPNGDAMLRETLSKRISVEDIGFATWQQSF
jgi:DNA primase